MDGENEDVPSLLEEWGFGAYVDKFKDQQVDIATLKNLDAEDLRDLFPIIRDRSQFKMHRKKWLERLNEEKGSSKAPGSQSVAPMSPAVQPDNLKLSSGSVDINGNNGVISFDLPTLLMEGDDISSDISQSIIQVLSTPSQDQCNDAQPVIPVINAVAQGESNNAESVIQVVMPPAQEQSNNTQPVTQARNPQILEERRLPVPNGRANVQVVPEAGPQAKKAKTYDLLSILQTSDDGKKVIQLYQNCKNTFQDDYHRALLAGCVISHEFGGDFNKMISRERFQFLSEEIAKVFPSDNSLVWYERFQDVNGKTCTKGKLIWKYYNKRRQYTKCGLIVKQSKKTTSDEETEDDPGQDENQADADVRASLLWLEGNKHPWDSVVHHWKNTFRFRQSLRHNPVRARNGDNGSIQALINKFKPLQEDNGYQLLELDFVQKYPQASMALFKEWPVLFAFLEQELRFKEPSFLTDAVYSSQEKILLVLLSLSKLFPVVTVASKKKRKQKGKETANNTLNAVGSQGKEASGDTVDGKKAFRPSEAVMQDAFLLNSPTLVHMQEYQSKRRNTLYSLGLNLQPFAAVIGPKENPLQCLVVLDEFFYDVESPLKAVDIVFKCIHALHLDYPPEAEQMWFFLQEFVYGITSRYDKHFAHVKTLGTRYQVFKRQLAQS